MSEAAEFFGTTLACMMVIIGGGVLVFSIACVIVTLSGGIITLSCGIVEKINDVKSKFKKKEQK